MTVMLGHMVRVAPGTCSPQRLAVVAAAGANSSSASRHGLIFILVMTPHNNFCVFAICKAVLGPPKRGEKILLSNQDSSGQKQGIKIVQHPETVSKLKELKFYSLGVKNIVSLMGMIPVQVL